MSEELDRTSPKHAAKIIEALCPSEGDRKLVLGQLLRSIAIAEHAGPQSWAVTLFSNGFRLNVGSVEAFTFFDGKVSLFLHGTFPAEAQLLGDVFPCRLKRCPQPSHVFVGGLAALHQLSPGFMSAHEAYVRGSAINQGGKPLRTSFSRHHSPGLHAYASQAVGKAEAYVGKAAAYWMVRGSPAENGDFDFIKPGALGQWRTKRPPRSWLPGDRLLFWASSPRRELIALGEFEGETKQYTDEGALVYNVRYLTSVAARPIALKELRNESVLKDAIFLKTGPAGSVIRLTEVEGQYLYWLLGNRNSAMAAVWPDAAGAAPLSDIDESAIEGEARLVSHLRRERNRSLTESKKNAVLAATGALECEACGFDFRVRYGSLGEGFCEVHHRQPLAQKNGSTVTSLKDLAVVCSNCHRIIHRSACALSVEALKGMLKDAQRTFSADGSLAARLDRR